MPTLNELQSTIPNNTIRILNHTSSLTILPNKKASLSDLPNILRISLFHEKQNVEYYEFLDSEYKLCKIGTPWSYEDFLDIIELEVVCSVSVGKSFESVLEKIQTNSSVGKSISSSIPTVSGKLPSNIAYNHGPNFPSKELLQNTRSCGNRVYVCSYNPCSRTIHYCDFLDDMIFSNLFSLLTELGVVRIVYSDMKLQKIVLNSGLAHTHIPQGLDALSMLCKYLRVDIRALQHCEKPTNFRGYGEQSALGIDPHRMHCDGRITGQNFMRTNGSECENVSSIICPRIDRQIEQSAFSAATQTHPRTNGSVGENVSMMSTDTIRKDSSLCTATQTRLQINRPIAEALADIITLVPYTLNTFAKLPINVPSSLHLKQLCSVLNLQTKQGNQLFLQFLNQPLIQIQDILYRQCLSTFLYFTKNLEKILRRLNQLSKYCHRLLRLSVSELSQLCDLLMDCNELVDCLTNGLSSFERGYDNMFRSEQEVLLTEIRSIFQGNKATPNYHRNLETGSNIDSRTQFAGFYTEFLSRLCGTFTLNESKSEIISSVETDLIAPLTSLIPQFSVIQSTIQNTIDSQTLEIKSTNEELTKKKHQILSAIQDELTHFRNLHAKVSLEKKQQSFLLKISKKDYQAFKKQVNVSEKHVLKGHVLFSSKRLEELNNELLFVEKLVENENRGVLDSLRVFVNDYEGGLSAFMYLVGFIDVLHAFGRLHDLGYTRAYFLKPGYKSGGVERCDGVLFEHKGSDCAPANVVVPDNAHSNTNGSECAATKYNKDIPAHGTADTSIIGPTAPVENIPQNSLSNLLRSTPECNFSILIRECFHPLIKNCIPNSLILTNKRFVTITGPNMGGKSTYLKKIAINCILGQIGCPVPSRLSIQPIFRNFSVRVSVDDCLNRELSCFMVEMVDIAHIVCGLTVQQNIDQMCSTQRDLKVDYLHEKPLGENNIHSENSLGGNAEYSGNLIRVNSHGGNFQYSQNAIHENSLGRNNFHSKHAIHQNSLVGNAELLENPTAENSFGRNIRNSQNPTHENSFAGNSIHKNADRSEDILSVNSLGENAVHEYSPRGNANQNLSQNHPTYDNPSTESPLCINTVDGLNQGYTVNDLPNLVLIDELGRGTNSIDGLAIAKSTRDFIQKTNTICLFATHFNELCSTKTCNMTVEIDEDSCLLYKIKEGVSCGSYAILVGEKVGIPSSVIEEAKELIKNYDNGD